MSFPNQDYNKRDRSLPAGCKDLLDAIKHEQACALPTIPDPPISRQVVLPDKVSIQHLAEVSGASAHTIALVILQEMRVVFGVGRSVDFEIAAKILRKYGVAAIRTA